MEKRRYIQLDALRGIAAVSVFVSHLRSIYPNGWSIFEMTPLRMFSSGHSAVILFFILSGFVLSLNFFSKKKITYNKFVLRRFYRIYLPYIISIVFGIMLFSLFKRNPIVNLSTWVYTGGHPSISWPLILNHLFMIGSYPNNTVNPVIWTLIVEMRVALVFPLLVFLSKKLSFIHFISSLILLSLMGEAIHKQLYLHGIDYFETFHYILFFSLGIILVKYKDKIVYYYQKTRYKYLIFVLGLLLYAYGPIISAVFEKISFSFLTQAISDYTIGIGVTIIMVEILSESKIFVVLEHKFLQFLGKISFSFYLYHTIILLSLLNIFFKNVHSLFFIFPLGFLITVIVATLSYYLVEVPSIKLGRIKK